MRFILLLVFTSLSLGQSFEKFILIKPNGERIVGENGNLSEQIFRGIDNKNVPFSIKSSDIDRLYIANNSKLVPIGLLGLLTGSIIGISLDYNRYTSEFSGNTGVILVSAVLGTLLGGIIGSKMYSWDTISRQDIAKNRFTNYQSKICFQINIKI